MTPTLDLKHLLKRGALLAARPTGDRSAIRSSSPKRPFRCCWPCRSSERRGAGRACCSEEISPELPAGSLAHIFTTIASALLSEPFALVAFVTAFASSCCGGSILMFAVKGGTVEVLAAANADAGPIEQQPLTIDYCGTRRGSR